MTVRGRQADHHGNPDNHLVFLSLPPLLTLSQVTTIGKISVLHVTPTILIDESELHEEFVRASGPGGQNVNKVATAVQLRFNVMESPALPEGVRQRLIKLAGKRISNEGDLIIEAKEARSQLQNRADARTQLVALIQQATVKPRVRRKTKPTYASQQRRIEQKKQRGATKKLRQSKPGGEG
jgi:ribosome-associated protein